MEMTRKEFLRFALAAAGAALAAACGGTSTSEPAQEQPGNCLANGTLASIAANHGHVLLVPKVGVTAEVQKTYDIRGSADHMHQVTLTAADMAALRQNMQAREVSTTDIAHSHSSSVSCA